MAAVLRHHDKHGRQHTSADAARAIGVPYSTLDRWMRLGAVPDFEKAGRLADYMGITLDELRALYFDRKADIVAPQRASGQEPKESPVTTAERVHGTVQRTGPARRAAKKRAKRNPGTGTG